jgi:hypothetical protein
VDLRLEVPVLPICHHPVALEGAPVGFRAAAWVTNIPRPQMAREMVRRARCEVVYNSALPGVGGMTRVLGTLLNLYQSLEAEETGLGRLTTGAHLDEEQIFRQIDKVTAARAALEKANAHMLLEIRKQMTEEQVDKLDEHRHGPPE